MTGRCQQRNRGASDEREVMRKLRGMRRVGRDKTVNLLGFQLKEKDAMEGGPS
jgi:hypothetical protein